MSAIRNLHMELGLDYPSGPACLLSRVMKGVGRSTGGTRTRLPITTPILRSLCQCLVNSKIRHPADSAMLRAAFTLAFHGFFRCGELTAELRPQHVSVDNRLRSMTVHLTRSKTDTSGSGVDVRVGSCADHLICPVRTMQSYLQLRPTVDGPLLAYHNNTPLTRQAITNELRTLLPLCGVAEPSSYASHSFRIGAATSAAIAGVPDHLIRHMGRWRSCCKSDPRSHTYILITRQLKNTFTSWSQWERNLPERTSTAPS